jgi:hypothetical protein
VLQTHLHIINVRTATDHAPRLEVAHDLLEWLVNGEAD